MKAKISQLLYGAFFLMSCAKMDQVPNAETAGVSQPAEEILWVNCEAPHGKIFDALSSDLSAKTSSLLKESDRGQRFNFIEKELSQIRGDEPMVLCFFQYSTVRYNIDIETSKFPELSTKIDPKKITLVGFKHARSTPDLGLVNTGLYKFWSMLFYNTSIDIENPENVSALKEFTNFLASASGKK